MSLIDTLGGVNGAYFRAAMRPISLVDQAASLSLAVANPEASGAALVTLSQTAQLRMREEGNVMSNSFRGITYAQTVQTGLSALNKQLTQMSEIAVAAQDETLNTEERQELQSQFSELKLQTKMLQIRQRVGNQRVISDDKQTNIAIPVGEKYTGSSENVNLPINGLTMTSLADTVNLTDASAAAAAAQKISDDLKAVSTRQEEVTKTSQQLASIHQAALTAYQSQDEFTVDIEKIQSALQTTSRDEYQSVAMMSYGPISQASSALANPWLSMLLR